MTYYADDHREDQDKEEEPSDIESLIFYANTTRWLAQRIKKELEAKDAEINALKELRDLKK